MNIRMYKPSTRRNEDCTGRGKSVDKGHYIEKGNPLCNCLSRVTNHVTDVKQL